MNSHALGTRKTRKGMNAHASGRATGFIAREAMVAGARVS